MCRASRNSIALAIRVVAAAIARTLGVCMVERSWPRYRESEPFSFQTVALRRTGMPAATRTIPTASTDQNRRHMPETRGGSKASTNGGLPRKKENERKRTNEREGDRDGEKRRRRRVKAKGGVGMKRKELLHQIPSNANGCNGNWAVDTTGTWRRSLRTSISPAVAPPPR